jgi:hypothetical protein
LIVSRSATGRETINQGVAHFFFSGGVPYWILLRAACCWRIRSTRWSKLSRGLPFLSSASFLVMNPDR